MTTNKPKTFVKPDECPACFYEMDCSTQVGGGHARPKPGSISLCLNCGAANKFDENLNIVVMSEDEFEALSDPAKDLIRKAQRYVKQRGPIRPRR